MKEKSKNLIVIIGNGFDLAHGLKTSYNDFANYYLEEVIVNEITKNIDKSTIINNNFKKKIKEVTFLKENPSMESFQKKLSINLIKDKKDTELQIFIKILITKKNQEIKKSINDKLYLLQNILTNSFLAKLYSNSFENWFDIEQAYYDELLNIFHDKYNDEDQPLFVERIDALNLDFQEIKEALKKYLKDKIKPTHNGSVNYYFENHFIDRENVSFINFNYTNTINCYRHSVNLNLNKNIHIHNSLSEDIIFGYGDDTDEMYQKMKASKNNNFLKYFKTFDYLKSKNYRKVLNQLAIFDKYDVLVIGHSLGGTDKTILKTILDTNSCENIELLKRSDFDTDERYEELNLLEKEQLKADNLFELYANLARIFDSEASLREKVIPFEWSINFPVMANYDYDKIQKREKELFLKKSNPVTYYPMS
ncbi:bacteriophage abortive infection AbiH family protein [Tenacibaculum finnmarkense genomovar ulcerans]|uniref:AbiH family protein n=1 Tax=Tenacibaculum finnmarkense TaxID=2781243 RepID=UPI001E387A74|nr:AbiH family protein [Tenacibaculum finnmarkense]MCD8454111.1 bacteriophage abortive infection AbiH family protein [Tenacibaculum finnmarkense genomovar ulcerans]